MCGKVETIDKIERKKMWLRLRSPIFDHGTVGVPVRRQMRRNCAKEEQELVELKEMGLAVEEAVDPFDKDRWRAAVKQVRELRNITHLPVGD